MTRKEAGDHLSQKFTNRNGPNEKTYRFDDENTVESSDVDTSKFTVCYLVRKNDGQISYAEHCTKTKNPEEVIAEFEAGPGSTGETMIAWRMSDGKGHYLPASKIFHREKEDEKSVLRWFGYIS